jgi:aminoglycoside phosphotransferase (APT) family kinase protein
MAGAAAPDLAALTLLVQPARPGRRVVAAQPLAGGLLHPGWRLTLEDGPPDLVLRFYPQDPETAEKERAVAARVSGRVPVAAFLHLDPDGALGGRPYALLAWCEGMPLDRALEGVAPADREALGRACGATVAAIAAERFPQGGMLDARLAVMPWPESPGELIRRTLLDGAAASLLGAESCRAIARLVGEHGARLSELAADSRLVHGDLRAANLLVARQGGGWRVAAVLDWELCHAGTPLLDLGTLLRDDPGDAFATGLAAGFRAGGGTLPGGWLRFARLLDLVALGDALGSRESAVASYARSRILSVKKYFL